MRILSRLEVGTKLALVTTVILAVFSLWIYLYFPERLKRQAVDALGQRATSIADMTALGLGPAMVNSDTTAIAAALIPLRRNRDLVYFTVTDRSGKQVASFNEMAAPTTGEFSEATSPRKQRPVITGMTAGEPSETTAAMSDDGRQYRTITPIRFHGRRMGTLTVGLTLDRVLDEFQRSKAIIAFVTLIAFGLGALAVFALSTVITGPLHRIAETAEHIAAGDLQRRAAIEGRDEVGQLAKTFNLMLDRIAAARAELETLNRTLEQRVEERTQELLGEITERRRTEERYRLLFERNLAAVYIASIDGTIISCNDACARLFGFEFAEEFLENGASIRYMHEHHREAVLRRLEANGAVFNEEVQLRDCNNQPVWALENVRLVQARPGDRPTLEGILLDISDRKRAEEEIAYRAYHDELTGLPNRPLYVDRVEVALANAVRKKLRIAAMFLDLDDLKIVNDTLGHATGDALLKMVAARLTETLRHGDTVARVGGDEFVILLPEINHEAEALRASQKILRELAKPFVLDADELHITASIGVAIGPRDGDSAEILIRNADGAMYRAKQSGGNRVELYRHVGPAILGRVAQEEELRQAMDRDEFILLYQPQVRIDSRELVGVEALVRWNHPERGMIEPAGFISVAERTGLISVLGEIVLRKACEQGVVWQNEGFALPRVSVNVSPRQLYQRNFVGMVERVLAMTGFDPNFLEMELTESMAVSKSERIREILRGLREMGIAIGVDDFGTGQSSLTYIKEFPVDTVKIDRSFVIDVVQKKSDQSIVSAVLLVANELGLRTIAEGVEDNDQCDFLRDHGCQEIQGYLISRPIAPSVLQKMFLRGPVTA